MSQGSLTLDATYDSETFYQELITADHWSDEGYRLTNEKVVYKNRDHDFGATTAQNPADVARYHAQFAALHDNKDSHWIHVDVPADTADTVSYLVTMGDPADAVNDLEQALNEVQNTLNP